MPGLVEREREERTKALAAIEARQAEEAALAKTREEHEQLRVSLEDLKKRHQTHQVALQRVEKAHQVRLTKAQNNLAALSDKTEAKKIEHDALARTIRTLKSQVRVLEKRKEKVVIETLKLREPHDLLADEVKDLARAKAAMTQELDQGATTLAEAKAAHALLEAETTTQKAELEAHRAGLARWHSDLSILQKRLQAQWLTTFQDRRFPKVISIKPL